jgi:predicted transcriptional regulator
MMPEPGKHAADDEAVIRIYPDMPNYVDSEAEFLAAVDKGLADIRAGRTVAFADVAAEFSRDDEPA